MSEGSRVMQKARMVKSADIPAEVLRPPQWPMWRVFAYTGKRGDIQRGQTFVRASSEAQAVELGKSALRMLGIRGRYVVNASRYYPWLDTALQGYYCYSE
jgi:hypothetical protein